MFKQTNETIRKYLLQTGITEQKLENHHNCLYRDDTTGTRIHVSTIFTCTFVRFYYPLFFLLMNKAFYEYSKY